MRRRKDHIDSEKSKEKLASNAKTAGSGQGFMDRGGPVEQSGPRPAPLVLQRVKGLLFCRVYRCRV